MDHHGPIPPEARLAADPPARPLHDRDAPTQLHPGPDAITVEFGLKFGGETGVIFTKGKAEGGPQGHRHLERRPGRAGTGGGRRR
ncbi:CU044_2847 family protein [Actinocorallia sp. API 0066]|uniref:CU044_2847 family protein n=1 Tax=Actinocorallia sp. API 0066 TaxID=2896846 RepID=UPI0035AB6B25